MNRDTPIVTTPREVIEAAIPRGYTVICCNCSQLLGSPHKCECGNEINSEQCEENCGLCVKCEAEALKD